MTLHSSASPRIVRSSAGWRSRVLVSSWTGTSGRSSASEVRLDTAEASRVWARYKSEIARLSARLANVRAEAHYENSLIQSNESAAPHEVKHEAGDLACVLSGDQAKIVDSFTAKLAGDDRDRRKQDETRNPNVKGRRSSLGVFGGPIFPTGEGAPP